MGAAGEERTLSQVLLPKPKRNGQFSPTSALLNLFCGMLGPGFLSIPSAFKSSGLWAGLTLVFLVGGFCLTSMYRLVLTSQILTKRCKEKGLTCLSYSNTAEMAFQEASPHLAKAARVAKYAVDVTVFLFQFGVLVVSFVFVEEHLPELLPVIGIPADKSKWFMPVYFLFQLILCISASMKILTFLAMLGNFTIFAVMGLITSEMINKGFYRTGELPAITNLGGISVAAGSLIYAMEGQTMILPLENRLTHKKSMLSLWGVLCTAINLVIILYAAVGFYGYLCFANDVEGSISLNLPKDTISHIVQLLLVCKIYVGTALQLHVVTDLVWPPGKEETKGTPITKRLFPPFVLLLAFVGAILLGQLSFVIPLIGLTTGVILSLIYPPILHTLVTTVDETPTPYKIFVYCSNAVMVLVGSYFLITGTIDLFS